MATNYLKQVIVYTLDPKSIPLGFVSKSQLPPYDDTKYVYWDFGDSDSESRAIFLDPGRIKTVRMVEKKIFGDLILHFMEFNLHTFHPQNSKIPNDLINGDLFYNYSWDIPDNMKNEYFEISDTIEFKSCNENEEQYTDKSLFIIRREPLTFIKPGPKLELQKLSRESPTKCFHMYITFGEVNSGSEINNDVKVIFLQNFYSKLYDYPLPQDTLIYLQVFIPRYPWNQYIQNLLKLR